MNRKSCRESCDGAAARRRGPCCSVLVLVAIVLPLLGVVHVTRSLAPLVDSNRRLRACLASQRVLQQAVRRAWKEEGIKVWTLREPTLKMLLERKLIESIPRCPGSGRGSGDQGRYRLLRCEGEWIVFCTEHGALDLPGGCSIYSSVREQARALGVDDPELLSRCSTLSRYDMGWDREDVAALGHLLHGPGTVKRQG